MLASSQVRKSSLQGLVRSKNVVGPFGSALRNLAITPRSAATPDPDKDEDNILPVRSKGRRELLPCVLLRKVEIVIIDFLLLLLCLFSFS
jgi:hypothetical protein